MEYLDGWLVGSDNILISSIFVPHAATSNIRSSPPIHALTISTFTFYLSTVQRKYTQKCLLACSLFRAHDQCLMSFSFAWTIYLLTLIIWIVRSFVRSSHFFFFTWIVVLILAHVPMKMILWNWNANTQPTHGVFQEFDDLMNVNVSCSTRFLFGFYFSFIFPVVFVEHFFDPVCAAKWCLSMLEAYLRCLFALLILCCFWPI